MNRIRRGLVFALGIGVGIALGIPIARTMQSPPRPKLLPLAEVPAPAARPEVATWQTFMRDKQVRKVADNVYNATGYGLATATMIVAPQGRIIVDTMETTAVAREVLAAFDAISNAPIAAVIYTHGHPDHTGGTAVFAGPDTPIYGRKEFAALAAEQRSPVGTAYRIRSIRQFGLALPEDSPAHFLHIDVHNLEQTMPPTVQHDAPRTTVEIAGETIELIHAPGETIDTQAVWLPASKTLIVGDDMYPAFPNLYTLRGEPSRDVWRWAEVMDLLASFPAEHLISGHGPPLSGADEVHTALVAYGDAIQFVHDQTVKGINEGRTPDEIAATLRLPAHLAEHPWLGELYGRVDWSSRAIASSYINFFGGDAKDLHPLTPRERAERLHSLSKSGLELVPAARQALTSGDAQWAVELASSALALNPDDADARAARADALRACAAAETSVNGINYYLTQAAETDGSLLLEDPIRKLSPEYIKGIPLQQIFTALRCRLDAARAESTEKAIAFTFPDANETWRIHVRRGIAEITTGAPGNVSAHVTMPAQDFKEMLLGQRIAALTLLTTASIEGSVLDVKEVMELFR